MNLIKGKLGLCILFFLVFIVGCFVGIGTASYQYYRYVFSKVVDRSAIELALQINLVCKLRLGEVKAAITQLENMIDDNVVSVALTPNIPIPQTDFRHHVLRGVKTYRQVYPYQTQFASKIDDALKDIAKIDTFKCDSPLCRLVKHAESQKDR
jgi:hypothetical protein